MIRTLYKGITWVVNNIIRHLFMWTQVLAHWVIWAVYFIPILAIVFPLEKLYKLFTGRDIYDGGKKS